LFRSKIFPGQTGSGETASIQNKNFQLACVWLITVFALGLIFSGCYTKKIEKAFDGDFTKEKNNRMINEYCQSCHIHKNFVPAPHIAKLSRKYKMKIFRRATECRTCHYLEKKFAENDFSRKTRTPAQVNRGKYRGFTQDAPEPAEKDE